jgi:hypothetical protein
MTLIAQVGWGALFSLPFGFSFLALRLSTVVLGAIGLVAVYAIARELGAARRLALVGAAAVGVNPLYLSLSLSFMTDVPFTALAALSVLFFVRSFRTDARWDRFLGFACAAAALLVRQPGIVVPLAFAAVFAAKQGPTRKTLTDAVLPTAALATLVLLFPAIARATFGLPQGFIGAHGIFEGIRASAAADILSIPRTVGDRLLVQLLYIGVFILPVSILGAAGAWALARSQDRRRVLALGAGALALALGGVVLVRGGSMPFSGNVLFDLGLGPLLLRDTYLLNLPHFPTAPHGLWVAVTVAAVVGGALLLTGLALLARRALAARAAWPRAGDTQLVFVIAVSLLYAVGVAVATSSPQYGFFDRYVIFLLMPAIALVVGVASRVGRPSAAAFGAALALVGLYGAFAVAGTHDYLAWNRARWDALADVRRTGVPPAEIDGGLEFNGWYGYDPAYRTNSRRFWWVKGDEYVVAFGSIERYAEVRRYSYRRWLPPGRGTIVLLRRAGGR